MSAAASGVRYRLAAVRDREAIAALLDAEQLPCADLGTSGVVLLLAEEAMRLVGCIGIEPHGNTGVIRSLCVVPERRRSGIARNLVARAEALALSGGVHTLYLLTQGAVDFWLACAYAIVARGGAPAAIRMSAEFATLCPTSATCMTRQLTGPMRKMGKNELTLSVDETGARYWALATGRAQLTYYDVPPGGAFPAHSHDGEQITFVLEGSLSFDSGDGPVTIEAGDAVLVPAGVRHAVTAGSSGARAVDAWGYPLATYYDDQR